MRDEDLEVVRQLLKSRLRHHLYRTKADERGPSEQMWRSLLVWQEELLASAEAAWGIFLAARGRPSLELVQRAHDEAVEDVRESVSAQRETLEPLIAAYAAAFDPYDLTEHPAEA